MESCSPAASYVPLAINIMVHTLILFTILSIFFMYYIADVAHETFNHEIAHNINEAIDKLFDSVSPDEKALFKQYTGNVSNIKVFETLKKKYSEPDPLVELHNKWLFKTIVTSNVAYFIIVLLTIILLMYQCNQCIPIKDILIENVLTFICVGIVEYLFFTRVALKFIPSKPSLIVDTFFESLKENLTPKK